ELAAGSAGANEMADGGSDVFRAGKRLFGEVEHAGKCADAAAGDNEFAKVKIKIKVESLNRCNVTSLQRRGAFSDSTIQRFNDSTRCSAFTLVEMILAVGVAALVLIAVNAVLFTALHLR